MKKLTRYSFSALREVATVLNKQQQMAIIGGSDYWSDHGIWYTDSNGNQYWQRTTPDSGDSGYYYNDSGYGTATNGMMEGLETISQAQFFAWPADEFWPGGNVEGMGYVPADITATALQSKPGLYYFSGPGGYLGSDNPLQSKINEMAMKVIGFIPGFSVITEPIQATIDGWKDNFNRQLGQIITDYNYPSAKPFYIEDIEFGIYIVRDKDGTMLGRIDSDKTYSPQPPGYPYNGTPIYYY